MNVLIGEISSYKAIVIVKFIKVNYPNINVYTYDYHQFTYRFHSKYSDKHFRLKETPKNNDGFLFELSSVVRENKIDLFIPVHSDSIGLILKNKNLFDNTLNYLGDYDTYMVMHTKDSLMNLAKTLFIKIPKNYNVLNSIVLPCVAKPKTSSSSKGVFYLKNQKDLEKFKRETRENYIYQEYIQGIGCGYSIYCIDGKIIKEYGHRRIAEFPVTGGSSVYRTTFNHPNMKIIAQKILGQLSWTGFVMFEFKLTTEGELVLIEINPRIWGSINQALSNGVNLFEPILPGKAIGEEQNFLINTYLTPQVYFSFLLYIIHGDFRPLINFFRNLHRNKADVSLFNDWRAWLSVIFRNIL